MAHPLHLARTADVLDGEREVYVLKQRRMVELQRIFSNRRRRLVQIDKLRRDVVRIRQLLAERELCNRADEPFIADYRFIDNTYLNFVHVYS